MSENKERYELEVRRDAPVPMLAVSLEEAKAQVHAVQQFIKSLMVEDVDYGTIPGTPKPTLYQPGAHKLINIYALDVTTELLDSIEDWDKPFFAYRYRTTLRHRGRAVGTCEGSCNSLESRYRWRWVPEHNLPVGLDKATLESRGGKISEFDFAIEKAETGGKYGKPEAYWQRFRDAIESGEAKKVQRATKSGKSYGAWEIDGASYRVPNDDIFSLVNTLQKMGQKRSVVGATLMATRTGDIFTQDIEDMNIVEGDYREVPLKPRLDEEDGGDPEEIIPVHWTVKQDWRVFWAYWKGQKGLTEADIHAAAGVESMKNYTGTKDELRAAVDAYIAAQIEVDSEDDPLDRSEVVKDMLGNSTEAFRDVSGGRSTIS